MLKFVKRLTLGATIVMTVFSAVPTLPMLPSVSVEVDAAEIEPRADVVYWIYRTLADGTMQKRRWNATRGYWVDPHWITVVK